jgi:hypothetical protein
VTTKPKNDDRARRLARERQRARRRAAQRKDERALAIASGEADGLSPREYAVRNGLHILTVYKRVADGTLHHKRLGKRIVIDARQ